MTRQIVHQVKIEAEFVHCDSTSAHAFTAVADLLNMVDWTDIAKHLPISSGFVRTASIQFWCVRLRHQLLRRGIHTYFISEELKEL